jgi:hypothetical protein
MAQEAFCEKHGPYDASLTACPYCARQSSGRPQQPAPLWDNKEAAAGWGNHAQAATYGDDLEETDVRTGRGRSDNSLDETDLPRRYQRKGDGRDTLDDINETVIDRPAKTGLLGWLIVKEGLRRGTVYEIEDGATIGRDRADIRINDPKLSRPHAKVKLENEQFEVWDLASENGVFVNGERIRSATPLKENDEIKLGDIVLVLKTLG